MKNSKKFFVALTVMVCILATSVITVGAVENVNWKNIYQSKIQQIENEYKQSKRTVDDLYNIKYYSLQDFNFDGVPELYHALVAKMPNGYEVQAGTEEIYYIKNGKISLGKIENPEKLGLLPAINSNNTAKDRQWQYAMYKSSINKVVFVTKSSWVGPENSGKVVISELYFDSYSGVVSSQVFYQGNHALGKEPSNLSGFTYVGNALTYSAEVKTPVDQIWKWTPPYIVADKVGNSTITTSAPKNWKSSFEDFIMNEKYLKTGQKYNTNDLNSMKIMLHDFEGDGTPEIIISNGKTGEEKTNYVYVYKNNKPTYLTEIAKGSNELVGLGNPQYPGLYLKRGSNGNYKGYYYTIKNGKFSEEFVVEESNGGIFVKTENMGLYNACKQNNQKLKNYSISEIRKMGWNKFLTNSLGNVTGLYSDVSIDSWYYDSVFYVADKGIMGSVSGNQFKPNDHVTRAMFITVLYRLEKEPETTRVAFSDVPSNSWYADAVSWASNKGIVNGVSETKFAPDNKITREQLSTILYRYVLYKNKNIIPNEYATKCFIDSSKVSSYAIPSMNWAVNTGIISGTDSMHLTPSGLATRAQTAVILQRFCEKYNFN